MGFTFDDSNPDATPIAEMHRLIEKDPRNAERIFPYIGGEEVNNSPTHAHHRYAIDFFDRSEEEAWEWPDLMQIVKDKVKPIRDVQKRDALRERWWQYAEKRPGLVRAIQGIARVLVTNCGATSHISFSFQSSQTVFANTLAVFPLSEDSSFCLLQSRIHEIWARFFGSSMKDDLRYTPSDCFETFPFPPNWQENTTLESIGKIYYEYRADLMVRHNEGLTDTYNRFHDPDETNPDILKLRELHAQMDQAVLDAYGWSDIPTDCEFRLDYEDDDDEGTSKRKKPWRYRWPEEIHDEVLARLLKLNQERHLEEVRGHKAAQKTSNSTGKGAKKAKSGAAPPTIPGLEM